MSAEQTGLLDAQSEGTANIRRSTRKRRVQLRIIIALAIFCVLMEGIAWLGDKVPFARKLIDAYAEKIFPKISVPFARITEKLPFSLGEVLIIIALIGVPLSLILLAILMIINRKNRDGRRKVRRIYGYTYAWIFVYILLTETLNCFPLYHTSTFAQLYDYPNEQYTPAQLEQLADFLIDRTNELSLQVTRGSDGKFVLTADLDKTARKSLTALSDKYPRLGGYYTTPKRVKNSYFMSQQYLMGIYFPFTMEANYNDQMYELNMPDTVCHELAHTKGFIREDEANFIGFLACDISDNVEYRYSGYIRALKYVLGECEQNCSAQTTDRLYDKICNEVRADWNGNSDYWQQVQESDKGLIDSHTVAEVSDKAMETSLKLNGIEEGKRSYNMMVDLLLDWYFGKK